MWVCMVINLWFTTQVFYFLSLNLTAYCHPILSSADSMNSVNKNIRLFLLCPPESPPPSRSKSLWSSDWPALPLLLFPGFCVRFSQEPADQSVVLGERVVLSCVVFNYTGIVQWTKDGLALGVGEGLRGERTVTTVHCSTLATILGQIPRMPLCFVASIFLIGERKLAMN